MAPPVVLIHGFGSSFEHGWRRPGWVDLLQESGRRVIGVDLLGHGGTEKPHDPAAYSRVEELVKQQLRGEPELDVVGFSAGAAVAVRLLVDEPERYRKAALMGVGNQLLGSGDSGRRLAEALERGQDADDVDTVVFERLAQQPGNDRAALVAFQRREAGPIQATDLRRVTCPVLVVIGDRDFAHPADELVAAFGDARLLELRGADHYATPTDFRAMEAVLSFLG